MARNDVYLNINSLSPADAVVTGQQDMTAATIPELVLGDTPTFNFYFTDNTNVWPSWAGNAAYTLTWALSDAVAGDFAPAATTGNATPITGGWSVVLPLNSYDLVGLLNTKRVGQPYPVQNLWQQLRVTDPSGNEITRAMVWTPVRYRAISDTQNTESAWPTGGRFVTVNNVNELTTPTDAQFYAANPVPTSALGTASNGQLFIGNGTGFTKATLTAGTGVAITNGSGSITIDATSAQEILTATIKNAESVAITKGQVVYLFSATGGFPSVKLAYNTSDATSAKTFGVVSDTSIAPNGTGTVTCVGVVDGLNLGTYSDGDTVYLGATPGSFTATKPYAPNHLVYVGIIERANAGNGELYVRIQNGYELDELHDVQITTPPASGSLLIRDNTLSLWKAATLTAGTNIAVTNGDAAVTVGLTGTVAVANGGTGVTTSTGTGSVVLSTSPSLTTPSLGAASATSINGTTIPTSKTLVVTTDKLSALAATTSAELAGVISDETGSGALVFGTSPSLTTPNIGAATATSINSTTIPSSKTLVVTTDKLSALAATTSAELAGVISDETGTGALVFANTPTLVTPNIGAATGTSLTTTGNLTASDLIIGSSGPSAKSSIAARAARQGLVFDGTSGATVTGIPAFGTGDFTISAWVNQSAAKTAAITDANSESALFRIVSDGSVRWYEDGVLKLNLPSVISYGKMILLTLTRTGGVTTLYKDGVVNGSASYTATSCTNGISCIGRAIAGATSEVFNGSLSVQVYNRALSAAEVVALYEAGVPAGADYNNAGTTDIKPSAGTYAYWFGTGSISSATASSFTIAAGASSLAVRNVSGTFSAVSGRRYRATIVASGLNSAADFGSQGFTSSLSAGNVSNGTNVIEFTATSTASGYFAISSISSTAGGSISISSIVALGLLLAPDAGQAGGGLTWYDTSGNAANITLPASGVTWNVPTSSKVATGWTFGGSVGLTGLTQTSGTDTQWSLLNSSLSTQISLAVGKAASSGNAMYFAWAYNGGTPYGYIETYGGGSPIALQKGGGNLLLGTTTDSANGKLQLATHTTSAGGIGFGTDISLFRETSAKLSANSTDTSLTFALKVGGTQKAIIASDGTTTYIGATAAGGSTILYSGNATTALTLDSSQNATFAGSVKAPKVYSGSGSLSVASGATSTIFAPSDGVTQVLAYVDYYDPTSWSATATVTKASNNSALRIVASNTLIELSVSGTNVQVKNTGGSSLTIKYVYQRISEL